MRNDEPIHPALAEWSQLVCVRALAVTGARSQRSAAEELVSRLAAQKTAAPTILAWLTGKDVPRDAVIHAALMQAIGLPHTRDDLLADADKLDRDPTRLSPIAVKLVAHRIKIESLYPPALAAVVNTAPEQIAEKVAPALRRGKAKIYVKDELGHYDAPGTPPRLHRKKTGYESLGRIELKSYLDRTPNVHEFLECYYQLYCTRADKRELSDKCGFSSNTMENWTAGRNIPESESIESLKTKLFRDHPQYGERLGKLMITNRIAVAREQAALGDHVSAARELLEIPAEYWQAMVDRFLDSQSPAGRRAEEQWSGSITEFTSQAEYLYAIRRSLKMSADQVGREIGLASEEVNYLENPHRSAARANRRTLVDHYEQKQKDIMGQEALDEVPMERRAPHFFSRAKLEALPPVVKESTVRRGS